MTPNKRPWQSKTMWGGVIMLAALIASSFFGVEISPDEQATLIDKALASTDEAAGLIGFITVLYGRITANTDVTL